MGLHRVYMPELEPVPPGERVAVEGDEAHHAIRSKRLSSGDLVELLNGRGGVLVGEIIETVKLGKQGWRLDLTVRESRVEERPSPRVDVISAAAKGARLEHMIDELSQVGVASWSPLVSKRSVVEPRSGKLHRLERVASEASKQCGRAWVMEIGEQIDLGRALDRTNVIVADASGQGYQPVPGDATILVGPEGGWTEEELALARKRGAAVHSFGRHVMRIETAAVVASAVVLCNALQRPGV